jgi:hypothetical protein
MMPGFDWAAISAVSTSLLALLTFAFVVAAFLQWGDMRTAADASNRAAAAAEAAVQIQQATATEQSSLATFPVLGLELLEVAEKVYLRLYNASDLPAVAVDLVAIAAIDSMDVSPEEYVASNVGLESRSDYADLGTAGDGFFGVYDRLIYDDVSPRRVVVAPLGFLEPPESIHLMLQFQDLLGRSYLRSYWAHHATDPGSRRYHVTMHTDPHGMLKETPRIPFEPQTLPDDVPEHLLEFREIYRHSIPTGMLLGGQSSIEDRGTWSDL